MKKSSQALSDSLKIIISDIHGRHKLLKGVMTCFKKPIEVYNLGDVVAYSGSHNSCFYDPNECFDLLRRQGVKSVKGGHDIEALAEPDDTVTLLNSDGTVQPQDYNITEENKKHIHSLPLFILPVKHQTSVW